MSRAQQTGLMLMGSVGINATTANNMLNAFRHVAHDVTFTYALLHTGLPGTDGSANVSVGDNSLKAVSFDAAVGGALVLTTSPVWTNGGTSETLRYISVWSGPTGPGTDDPLWAAQLTDAQPWQDGDTYTLDSLGLEIGPLMAS